MAERRIGDTQEQIDRCLTCDKSVCINCYENQKRRETKMCRKINEIDFMEMYESGYTDTEIAQELGAHASSVWQYRKRRGLESNGKRGKSCKTK